MDTCRWAMHNLKKPFRSAMLQDHLAQCAQAKKTCDLMREDRAECNEKPTMPQSFTCDGSLLHCCSKFSESPSRNLLYHTVAGSVCLSVTLSFLAWSPFMLSFLKCSRFCPPPFLFLAFWILSSWVTVFVVSAYTLLSFQLRNPHTFPLCLSLFCLPHHSFSFAHC